MRWFYSLMLGIAIGSTIRYAIGWSTFEETLLGLVLTLVALVAVRGYEDS